MNSFVDLPLAPALQRKLAAGNFVTPTPVQAQAIPAALDGKDMIATAQTGTGKTLAFLVPIIHAFSAQHSKNVEALVLVPTRELAMQVHEQFEQLRSASTRPAALVIGGLPERKQLTALRSGARLIVATPGRLEDYLKRKLVDLRSVKTLVLDEADRMLDMGFLPSIRRIIGALPENRQTLCFSATMEASVSSLVQQYLKSPVRIAFGSVLKPAESVLLDAFEVSGMEKRDVLRHLLYSKEGRTLVFARTKRGAERLAKELVRDGFSAAMIHGDRTQAQRTAALTGFHEGRFDVLVATDVAARGIHVQDVAHVINFDLPSIPEDFIHRVGRTGRAGNTGRASTLVSGAEVFELRSIERALKLRIERKKFDTAVIPAARVKDTLPNRSLTALPGERFV